jgi:hypothetical protein
LECDVQGGDADQIEGADTANAWVQGQFPFVDERDPNLVLSLSWPKHMEAQYLYPVAASTYTWATGAKLEVPCSEPEKVVKIERTECPDSFVNPIDPNHHSHVLRCYIELNITLEDYFTFTCHRLYLQSCPVAVYADDEYTGMWATSHAVGLIGLLLNVYMIMTW